MQDESRDAKENLKRNKKLIKHKKKVEKRYYSAQICGDSCVKIFTNLNLQHFEERNMTNSFPHKIICLYIRYFMLGLLFNKGSYQSSCVNEQICMA